MDEQPTTPNQENVIAPVDANNNVVVDAPISTEGSSGVDSVADQNNTNIAPVNPIVAQAPYIAPQGQSISEQMNTKTDVRKTSVAVIFFAMIVIAGLLGFFFLNNKDGASNMMNRLFPTSKNTTNTNNAKATTNTKATNTTSTTKNGNTTSSPETTDKSVANATKVPSSNTDSWNIYRIDSLGVEFNYPSTLKAGQLKRGEDFILYDAYINNPDDNKGEYITLASMADVVIQTRSTFSGDYKYVSLNTEIGQVDAKFTSGPDERVGGMKYEYEFFKDNLYYSYTLFNISEDKRLMSPEDFKLLVESTILY